MNKTAMLLFLGLLVFSLSCRDNSPPPPRVPVPSTDNRQAYLPPQAPKPIENNWPPPGPGMYDDEPLVSQHPPEGKAFIEAYSRVGHPRIVVFVNRTMEGNLVPVNSNDPVLSVERSR